MPNKLQQYFPMLRTREEILCEIEHRPNLCHTFYSWPEKAQNEFLDFTTGAKGVKMMYDFASKELLNPETHRERVNEFLSLLLEQPVKILEVLPNDGTRLADESTLLITDIVVELSDGSIVNLEIQKIGYDFPGQRSACYSADLLLRQYKRVQQKNHLKDPHAKVHYKDIKNVYTIVLFEKSPKSFYKYPNIFLHHFEPCSDTGLQLDLLQKYLFVPLDIFKEIKHNESIPINLKDRQEAWLAFLCMDDPEDIMVILEQYPEFRECYEQVYEICQNIEEVMSVFSKELAELDRNTTEFMIDRMQKELDQQAEDLKKKDYIIAELQETINRLTKENTSKNH